MTVGCPQRHAVNVLELLDLLERLGRKWGFAFESMQYHSLQKIAERHVFQLRDRFQHFQHPLFEAHSSLHPLNFNKSSFRLISTHALMVPRYTGTHKLRNVDVSAFVILSNDSGSIHRRQGSVMGHVGADGKASI